MISLIPAVAGRRTDITMSQQMSQATQERIDELIRRTQEKEEERKKKKRELQAGEATTSSSSHPLEPTKGQETTTATSKVGCTVLIKHTGMGDESEKTRKTDDKSSQEEEEIDVEEWEETTAEHGGESTEGDTDFDDETSVVEFEDPIYELSQSYEIEPEYEDMTPEQEAAEVQALTPTEQAEYRELTKLHQCQAELERKMTGMSKVIAERMKA